MNSIPDPPLNQALLAIHIDHAGHMIISIMSKNMSINYDCEGIASGTIERCLFYHYYVCDMPEEEFQPQIHSQKIVRRRLFEGEGVNFDAVNVDLKPYQ